MVKIKLESNLPTMALPVCLLGARVAGRENFCTVAWFTMIDDEPPLIGLVLAKQRCTKDGIVENGTFSVNIPDTQLVVKTDYCGLRSGYSADKSKVFKTFYGELHTAPMIEECPLSMECRHVRTVEFEGTDMIIGEIKSVYVDDRCVQAGKADLVRIAPLLYGMGAKQYFVLGENIAEAYKVGKDQK
jgi:flavin reductase (DIM6/NTAB) family NADH-FMN oxidoreductase RutF